MFYLSVLGRSYSITSHRMLQQCIDSLVQKIQHGVVVNFEKIGPDPAPLFLDPNKELEIIDCDKIKEWDPSFPADGQFKPPHTHNVSWYTNCKIL